MKRRVRPTNRDIVIRALLSGIAKVTYILAHGSPKKEEKVMLEGFLKQAKDTLTEFTKNPQLKNVQLAELLKEETLLKDLDTISAIHTVFHLAVCDARILRLTLNRHLYLPEELLELLYAMHMSTVKKEERALRDQVKKQTTQPLKIKATVTS